MAGPLEQRIGERLQAHCATLADAAARRECLADLLAFRERYGLRHAARRRPGDADPALPPSAGSEIGGATAQVPTQPPEAPALGSTGTPSGTAGALPPVAPILPLRVVQRRQVGYALYVYRLSDGSVWEDVEGARTRLREGALVGIEGARIGTARYMVSSNERRRVRALACGANAQGREAQRCRLLRDGALTF